ncbi:DUF4179 domain-containing protein [Sporolactobacillus sp. STCC-11]|uniref:DUF4179 domain-containing protein n=1 Tax=Sporolactobacillus caesalpiniae TaxID=3230362 RepID=UPI0033977576
MNKTSFKKETDKINVPQDRVMDAIHRGMEEAGGIGGASRKRHRKLAGGLVTAGTAAALIAFSFLSPSVSRVLAEVPILSAIYGRAYDSIGQNLSNQKLVTELNQSATDKGINITITSAYYDGASIGLTFKANGPIKVDDNGEQGKSFNAYYEVYGGDPNIADSKEVAQTRVIDNKYLGNVQLNYPKSILPKDATLPITFKEIGSQKGNWKFDVPIKQLPTTTIKTSAESQGKDGTVKVRYNSIVFGKSSTVLNYQVVVPAQDKHDQIGIENVVDDQGNKVQQRSDGILKKRIRNGKQIITKRLILSSSVRNQTKALTITPVNRKAEKVHFVSLNEKLPYTIKAEWSELAIRIEKMSFQNGEFTVNYQIILDRQRKNRFSYLFGDFTRNDVELVKKSEKNIYQKPLKHSVKVVDKQASRFSSTFKVNANDHDIDDYILRVGLSSLSVNMPEELSTATLKLN